MDNYNFNNNSTNGNFNSYSNGYTNDFSDIGAGFESGNPVITTTRQVRSLLAQEVIAKSFLFMFCALLITAFAAFTTDYSTLYYIYSGYNFYILIGAELLIVLASNFAIKRNMAVFAGVLYVAYAYLTGVTMSAILLVYTTASVTAIFLITAGLFAIMAIIGLVTKTDLSKLGNILLMGLIGIILSSVVNIYLGSTLFDTIICGVGVLIFVGLTAYDTQKIKNRVNMATDETVLTLALFGGFELYLDFINLFLKLLRLFGKEK